MYTKLDQLLEKTDGIILTSPHNMRYFSGFSGGEGAALISRRERIVFTDSRYTESAQSEAENFSVIETNSASEKAFEYAVKNGFGTVMFEDEDMCAAEYEHIKARIGSISMLGCSAELKKLRMVKTETELAAMRRAEAVACRAFEYALNIIRVGLRETELAAEIEYYMRKNGGEGAAFETIAVSGVRTSLPHGVPTQKPIEKGDFVTMDFGCASDGYCSDMTRTVVIGKATAKQRRVYNAVKEAQQVGLETIRAGITGREADNAARSVIEEMGFGKYFRHSLGHGVGLFIHELPNLSPKSEIILEENMVVTCEPGIYIPEFGGVRIEDMVCVKNDGIENFTTATKELIEI